MNDKTPYPVTFVVREVDSPFPPIYPDPLIYMVMLPLEEIPRQTNFRSSDDDLHIRLDIARQRFEEISGEPLGLKDETLIEEIAAGLKLLFAFPGHLTACFDYRS